MTDISRLTRTRAHDPLGADLLVRWGRLFVGASEAPEVIS